VYFTFVTDIRGDLRLFFGLKIGPGLQKKCPSSLQLATDVRRIGVNQPSSVKIGDSRDPDTAQWFLLGIRRLRENKSDGLSDILCQGRVSVVRLLEGA